MWERYRALPSLAGFPRSPMGTTRESGERRFETPQVMSISTTSERRDNALGQKIPISSKLLCGFSPSTKCKKKGKTVGSYSSEGRERGNFHSVELALKADVCICRSLAGGLNSM